MMLRSPVLFALAAMSLATAGAPALAGPPSPSPRPVLVPWTQPAELESVEAVLGHAAGLGFVDGLELGLGFTTRLSGADPVNSIVGLVGGRLGPLALGLGVSGIGDGPGTDTMTTRVDIGLALRLSDALSLGWRWHGLYNDEDAAIDAYDAWSMSATMRPWRALSVALAVDRFDTPGFDGDNLDAIVRLGLGIRPGTERLSLGLDAARQLGDANWAFGGSIRFIAFNGLTLGGYGRYNVVDGGDDRMEFGAMLGLTQGGLAFETGVDADDTLGGSAGEGVSMSMLLKAGSRRQHSLVTRDNIVVRLGIGGPIAERPQPGLLSQGPPTFGRWITALDMMTHDDRVSGVFLDIEGAPSWGQCWELRQALKRLQAAGKKVHAKLTVADMKAMYLASAADKIHLYVSGGLLLTGLSITRTYLLGLLEHLGVRAEFIQWEDYKSAPEQLTRSGPSDPSREVTRDVLEGVDEAWMAAVSEGRKLTRTRLKAILDEGPQSMHVAKTKGLVDTLISDDDVERLVREDFGADARLTRSYQPSPDGWKRWAKPRQIAVITVTGSIVDGGSSDGLPLPIVGGPTTGDRPVVAALEAAAAMPSVVGIIVRVDTGGGSATASDRIHRAVTKAAKAKPLVVSFGNAAASGGYYLAAGAPRILSTPLTITGSIGIFTGKVDVSGLYDKLGITTSTQQTAPRADLLGSHRGWTDDERTAARQTLKAYYDRFVGLVADGRGIDKARAYEIARGRVYLGSAALKLKLVDAHGGLWAAIQHVRAEAKVDPDEPLDLAYLQESSPGLLGLIARGLSLTAEVPTLPAAGIFGQLARYAGVIQTIERGGPLAMLPWEVEIR